MILQWIVLSVHLSVSGGSRISFNHSGFIYSHCSTTLSNDNVVPYLLLKDAAECTQVGEILLSPNRRASIILERQNSNVGKKIRTLMSNDL